MKKFKLILFVNLLLGILLFLNFNSCKHDPILPPTTGPDGTTPGDTSKKTPCDPNTIYFQKQILPILISNCTMSKCHDGAGGSEGKGLTNYNSVLKSGYINVIDPSGSKIYESITATSGEDKMPPSPNPALTTAQINLILKWMQQGAKNLFCEGLCDSFNIKFSSTIKPIIQNYCLGCHSVSTVANKGILLNTYAEIANSTNPATGKLIKTIIWAAGVVPMPYNGSKLGNCEIYQINKWNADGRPNN